MLQSTDIASLQFTSMNNHDRVRISVAAKSNELSTVVGVLGVLATANGSILRELPKRVLAHRDAGYNDFGFRYPTGELWWDEEPFEGVRVYTLLPGDVDAFVDVDAFDRLMTRFLRALASSIEARDEPIVHESWWPEFLADVETLENANRSTGKLPSVEP